jgi:hypothetical protein
LIPPGAGGRDQPDRSYSKIHRSITAEQSEVTCGYRCKSGGDSSRRRLCDAKRMQMQTLKQRLSIATAQRSGIATSAIPLSHRPDRSERVDAGMACVDYPSNGFERQGVDAATPGRYCT